MLEKYQHANSITANSRGHELWIGDRVSAENTQWLTENNIKTVITAAIDMKIQLPSQIKHHEYLIYDTKTQNILQYLDDATYKIYRGLINGSVLVHCGSGVSRSVSFVIAYMMKYQQKGFHEALKQVKSKRPGICPNLGFELQLKKYDQIVHFSSSSRSSFRYRRKSQAEPKGLATGYSEYFPSISSNGFKRTQSLMNSTRNSRFYNENIGKPIKSKELPPLIPNVALKKPSNLANQVDYLKKLAVFRFGAENIKKWGIN